MGKHKKHKYGGHSSSSSSSSSSDSSDDNYKHLPKHERKRMKKLKKQQKKGKIPHGSVPGMYPGPGQGGHHGMPHGGHGAPHGYPAGGSYPAGMAPPPGGSYPTGVAPPPGGYGQPPAGMYPGGQPGGYPAPGAGYPQQGYPAAPQAGYPGQAPGYPAPSAGGFAPGYPAPAPSAGGFAPAPAGAPGGAYPGQSGAPAAGGYAAPAPGSGITAGYDFTQPAQPQQPGYPGGAPPQQGYPGAAPPQPAGYAPPPGGQPGYAPPPGGQPGYAPPPGGQPGYAPPPGGQPGYAPPPGGQQGYTPQGQPGGAPPGQMAPGGVDNAAAQMQRMGLQGTTGMPRPTVRPAQNFSAEKDAGIIRAAMKGAGTDEQAIVGVISQRSNQQRGEIMKMFKTMHGKDLIRDLEGELSGDFRETIMAMFKPTTYYDAWSLHEAISGAGTKESVLIEILCTRTNAEIREINQCYQEHYKRTLEKDIKNDTSGHFKRLLVSCCQANRTELTPDQWQKLQHQGMEAVVDRSLAQQDAQKLFQAGEKKLGTDESAFLQVLAVRNHFQLRATFEEYVKIAGRDILSSIDREMSGDLKEGFKAVVMSAKNRPEYFADKAYAAMKGMGTQDSTLIRIIVSRSEIDLQDIKEIYLAKTHKTLATSIASDTSGDYKRLLLALVGQ